MINMSSRRGKSSFSAASRSSSSSSNRDVEGAKKLHQGIEEGLLKGRQQQPHSRPQGDASAASSSYTGMGGVGTNAAPRTGLSSHHRQALINATFSFLVVLMAAQSYKSGAEKRRAIRELGEAQDELAQSQQVLRSLVQIVQSDDDNNNDPNVIDGPLNALAEACAQAIVREQQQQQQLEQTQQQEQIRRWFPFGSRGSSAKRQSSNGVLSADDNALAQKQKQWRALLLPILKAQLEQTVGDAGLSPSERDQKRTLEAAHEQQSSESDEQQMIVDMMREQMTVEENDQGERVIKKRLFSI